MERNDWKINLLKNIVVPSQTVIVFFRLLRFVSFRFFSIKKFSCSKDKIKQSNCFYFKFHFSSSRHNRRIAAWNPYISCMHFWTDRGNYCLCNYFIGVTRTRTNDNTSNGMQTVNRWWRWSSIMSQRSRKSQCFYDIRIIEEVIWCDMLKQMNAVRSLGQNKTEQKISHTKPVFPTCNNYLVSFSSWH